MSETHSVSESRHGPLILLLLKLFFFLRLCIINVSYASFASFFLLASIFVMVAGAAASIVVFILFYDLFGWVPVRLSYYMRL